jgi:sulfur carrier protein
MQLQFNNEPITTTASTLQELLTEKGLITKNGIAVAVNDSVVQRTKWELHTLYDNDSVLVITAAAGG